MTYTAGKAWSLVSSTITSLIFSNFGSFGVLMNLVMKLVSYLGVAFSICVIVSKIYRALKESKETPAE